MMFGFKKHADHHTYPRCFRVTVLVVLLLAWPAAAEMPRNIILCIGDGMGPEQVKAGGMYANGAAGTLSFEGLPFQAMATTYSADNAITDSAASGTAMATGQKVNNGVISMAFPGDGSELKTILEICADLGKYTGLVTTTRMTHATPAVFGAHEPSRNNWDEIGDDYIDQTRPNVLLGGGAWGMTPATAQAAGYTVVTDRAGMLALDTESESFVSGQFGTDNMPYEFDGLGSFPHLSEMTATALAILENSPRGFFLMIEGGRIDHAGHVNDIERNVRETAEFSNAVQVILDWAQSRTDTLVLVTADHETGGMTVLANNGIGNAPTVSWSTTGHTAVNVPVYAWGQGADQVTGILDNTDLFAIVQPAIVPTANPMVIGLSFVTLALFACVILARRTPYRRAKQTIHS